MLPLLLVSRKSARVSCSNSFGGFRRRALRWSSWFRKVASLVRSFCVQRAGSIVVGGCLFCCVVCFESVCVRARGEAFRSLSTRLLAFVFPFSVLAGLLRSFFLFVSFLLRFSLSLCAWQAVHSTLAPSLLLFSPTTNNHHPPSRWPRTPLSFSTSRSAAARPVASR